MARVPGADESFRSWGESMSLFRVKPLDLILATAEKRSLKRQLGAFSLMMLGIGAIIGTGIFVLTSVAAQKAGPGMMWSFVIAGFVCALTALVYSEIAAIVPVAGSAYTYSYAVFGEMTAWMVAGRLFSNMRWRRPQWLSDGPATSTVFCMR